MRGRREGPTAPLTLGRGSAWRRLRGGRCSGAAAMVVVALGGQGGDVARGGGDCGAQRRGRGLFIAAGRRWGEVRGGGGSVPTGERRGAT